jgi:hypothetical protein
VLGKPEAAIIGEAVAGESVTVRKQLESLIANHERSLFDIGELLYQVRRNGFHQQWGYNTFSEYVESLKFKPRRARYLARISGVMSELGIERADYEVLGIAKLREITSLDLNGTWTNPQTGETTPFTDWIKKFVETGEDMTLDEIKQHVRTLKGLVGEDDLVFENFCIKRSVKDNVVEPAKELARRNIGSVGKDDEGMSKDASPGACLEVWCVEYLNNPANNVLPEERNEQT